MRLGRDHAPHRGALAGGGRCRASTTRPTCWTRASAGETMKRGNDRARIEWLEADIRGVDPALARPASSTRTRPSSGWTDTRSCSRACSESLAPGGALAVQMPRSREGRSHILMQRDPRLRRPRRARRSGPEPLRRGDRAQVGARPSEAYFDLLGGRRGAARHLDDRVLPGPARRGSGARVGERNRASSDPQRPRGR